MEYTETKASNYKESQSDKHFAKIMRPFTISSLGDINGKQILDLGCGNGEIFRLYLKEGASKITGFDLFQEQLDFVKKSYPEISQINTIQGDFTIPFDKNLLPDNSFDIVASQWGIVHINTFEKFETFMKNIYSVLKKGGKFFFHDYDKEIFEQHKLGPIFNQTNTFVKGFPAKVLDKIIFRLNDTGFEIEDYHWPSDVIIETAKKIGFVNVGLEFLKKEDFDYEAFTPDELQRIVESKSYRCISGEK